MADSFIMCMTARQSDKLMEQLKTEMTQGKSDLLEVVHHLSSGLKAWYCLMTHLGVDELRMCCGGAGYSEYSLFPDLFYKSSTMPTVEGETTVMAGQNAKYLLKKGVKNEMFGYLNHLTPLCATKNASDDWSSLDHLQEAL